MEARCTSCNRAIEYSGDRPRFCGFCGQPLAPTGLEETVTAPMTPFAGLGQHAAPDCVGPYSLLQELGRGGMGVVYEARQADTGRHVALKLLPKTVSHSDEAVERFLREGQLAAALSHPRSTFVYEAGEYEGQFYIAMELMPGGTVKDVVDREGALPISTAVDYILDVIDGLESAHAAGVIHRDVKPSNCFVDRDGRVKVGDYGLSKSLVSDAALTRTGAFMGTPMFAAPEQVKAGHIDARTDIYALGATLYYLLTGQAPFQGDAAGIIAQIASETAPSVRAANPKIPRELDQVIAKSLQKDPQRRQQTVTQMKDALLPFASHGSSMADVGRRLAAFFVDQTALGIVVSVVSALAVFVLMSSTGGLEFINDPWFRFITPVAAFTIILGYYVLAEGRFGRGLGKTLLGLNVVGPQGTPPGYARACLRALFIPGLWTICIYWLPAFSPFELPTGVEMVSSWERIGAIFGAQIYVVIGWLLSLACLATMRRGNGFRGLHELASGTRVVRLHVSREARRPNRIPVLVPVAQQGASMSYGPFEVTGTLGRGEAVTVFTARDEALGRSVWIYLQRTTVENFSAQRLSISRPTRAHWLQNGEADGNRWDAMEAIRGAPLASVAANSADWNWDQARQVLLSLCEELNAALADATLPKQLTLGQVWIDREVRLKLLDLPFEPKKDPPAVRAADDASQAKRAVGLFRAAAETCCDQCVVPGHAQDFLEELRPSPANKETLLRAEQHLRDIAHRPTTLRWDDRLGSLAVSFSLEQSIFYFMSLLMALVILLVPGIDVGWQLAVVAAGSLLVPAAMGFWFQGGPVFRFTGIQVRCLNQRRASRLRCAWRNFVAWAPLMASCAMLACLSMAMVKDPDALAVKEGSPFPVLLILMSCGGLVGMTIHAAGALVAMILPTRSLQDWLSGTVLVPR